MKIIFLLCFSVLLSLRSYSQCVQMTVQECISTRNDLVDYLDRVKSKLQDVQDQSDEIQNAVSEVFDFSLAFDDAWFTLSDMLGNIEFVRQFFNADDDGAFALDELTSKIYSSQNSIEAGISSLKDEVLYTLDQYRIEIDDISDFNLSLDCNSCTNCAGSGDSGDGGDDGGDIDDDDDGECPCAGAIMAAIDVLRDIDSKLSALSSLLSKVDEIIGLLSNIKNDLSDTKTYLIEDYDQKIDDILDVLKGFKGSNLLYEEYTNATKFVSGSQSWSMLDKARQINNSVGGYNIDYSYYKSLNWFSRIEYLLGEITGKWSPTNGTEGADFDEDTQVQIEEVASDEAWQSSTYLGQRNKIITVVDRVKVFVQNLNPFSGCFDSAYPPNKITILPDVSVQSDLIGNTFPSVTLDLNEAGDGSFSLLSLVELCHNILTFLYFVGFALIDIFAIYKFIAFLIFVNGWYWKIYNSWVSTMFNGGGR